MPTSPSYVVTFKWCALAAAAITFLSLIPQLQFWIVRRSEWRGAYAALQPDEVLYSAYVNALIDGRPRRNDPATGEDDHTQTPLHESLFSIQFIPPFIIAWFARVSGMSASSAFIALIGAAGLLASVSVFWLFASLTGDNKLAATGVLVVLCLGSLAGAHGLFGLLLEPDVRLLGMPFLRRYEPALPFPLFFVFCTLIWKALTASKERMANACAVLAGITLSVLVFSYFYLWTAAAAWLICIAALWMIMRSADMAKAMRVLITTSAPVIVALAVYVYLLSQLRSGSDKAYVLTFTRRLDLLRIPEILGAFALMALIAGWRRGIISLNEPRVIFAASFGLVPFLIFNQQVITGRALQPFHYEVLIVNYAVLVGLVMIAWLLLPAIPRRITLLIMGACFLWGAAELIVPLQVRSRSNVRDDEMVPALLRLKELANQDGTWEGLRGHGKSPALVFSPQLRVSELLPTWAPQGSLLAPGNAYFQEVSEAKRKERFYTHLYYCGISVEYLRQLLNGGGNDLILNRLVRGTIFGPERVVSFLDWDFQPIRQDEIEQEVRAYEIFAESFSREEAGKLPLNYAVTLGDSTFDFSRLDLWYERDAGERVGAYTLYRLKLRG